MIWFVFPRFRACEFGGLFSLALGGIPPVDSGPAEFPAGRFWLVNLGEKRLNDSRQPTDYVVQPGIRVLYKVCIHLGCLYKWVPTNDRFECPCHGSKYLVTGPRIDGPATRNLDTFQFDFVAANGSVSAAVDLVGAGRTEEAGSVPLPATYPVYPFALTTPIWIDHDVDGEFAPPGLPTWLSEPPEPE